MAQPILTHEDGRKATWFELFFDLVFVVAVASLAGRLLTHAAAARVGISPQQPLRTFRNCQATDSAYL